MHSLLVVDDQPAIRGLVARLARAAGYTVSEAGCAGEALDRMAACPSAVVLCDISMPDRSGLWLATQLHRQFPDTALVMMSGFGQRELEAGLENGAMASLSKPFTREELICILERAREWHLERVVTAAWKIAKPVPELDGSLAWQGHCLREGDGSGPRTKWSTSQ
jgi:two-component system NtrC family sensor kinase